MPCRRAMLLMVLMAAAAALPMRCMAQELRAQFLEPIESTPVKFDAEVKGSIGLFTNIANATFKPAGPGPFPAVVLSHTCGGIKDPHMKQHAQELLAEGYVVLPVDSFGPRGLENCASRILSGSAGVADAYAALARLATLPFVDQSRIYQVGYSWGAIVSTWLASPQSAAFAGSSLRFAASIANYGTCRYNDKYQFLLRDSDRPVLMLLGAKDQEFHTASCFPLLEQLKSAGSPVKWHVYPEATHAWDKPTNPARGAVYNEAVTRDATARLLAYLKETP